MNPRATVAEFRKDALWARLTSVTACCMARGSTRNKKERDDLTCFIG